MRILADTNIVAQAVRGLRAGGHDVLYAAERTVDPGDADLLREAVPEGRVFLTKDHDVGTLDFRDLHPHCRVLLADDLGSASAESNLGLAALSSFEMALLAGAFLRVGKGGVREAQG